MGSDPKNEIFERLGDDACDPNGLLSSLQNTAALELYRKLGFKEFCLERDFLLVDGVLQDEIHMVFRVAETP